MLTNFSPKSVSAGTKSQYAINIKMNKDGSFQIESSVIIKNISKDLWDNLIFYFIPNIFTPKTLKELKEPLDVPAAVALKSILLDGNPVDYDLNKDTLNIPLNKSIIPEQEVKVVFTYSLTLPEKGYRFTKNNQNYYLSQFYPMIATYREHKWNKEDYRFKGETYHTAFSDFKVTYDLPDGFTLASTSENDKFPSKKSGTFQSNNVKDFFIAILDNPKVVTKVVDNVDVRVFGVEDDEVLVHEISKTAVDAFQYFQEKIGSYPSNQLDIILDSTGMEYPGIVTAREIANFGPVNGSFLKNMVVHEIAHQWFYGMISNDPYYDAWLDEGFSEFATSLYSFSKTKEKIPYEQLEEFLEEGESIPINLPLNEYENNSNNYIYGKAHAMLWKLFEHEGEIDEAEIFLKTYYDYYKFKEINSKEFVRFAKLYFNIKDDSFFQDWLVLQ